MGNNKISRTTFNSMTIEQQVNFFNKKLHEGEKITKICNDIEISYNTIRDRFKRNFFTYNRQLRQYECIEYVFPYDDEIMEKALEKIVTRVFNKTPNNKNHFVCDLKGNVVNRSFRIYDDILKDFTEFCSNSNYNQYDILSKFIKEGIEKYNKEAV